MIIGITGSFGAGKNAVVEYLVTKYNFRHFSARAFITEEVVRRDMPVNRDSMIVVANDLRKEHGPTYILDHLMQQAKEYGGDAVVESVRALAEAASVKEHNGVVVGVDADPDVRYARVVKRDSETDRVTFEKWSAQEKAESNPDDPTKQNIFGALKHSDYIITNNGSLEELHRQVDEVLSKIQAA